jgi:hypothetical protein
MTIIGLSNMDKPEIFFTVAHSIVYSFLISILGSGIILSQKPGLTDKFVF